MVRAQKPSRHQAISAAAQQMLALGESGRFEFNLTWLRLVRCSHGTAPNIAHDFY
jgi:hypothetical protein